MLISTKANRSRNVKYWLPHPISSKLLALVGILVASGYGAVTNPTPAAAFPKAACSGIAGVSDSGPFSWPIGVFFDSFSAQLTIRGRLALTQFAQRAIACQPQKIVVEANIDAAEARNSTGLDGRRARAVRIFLQNAAIPAATISVVLRGNRSPLIPTAEGVAEPQNRSVMIHAY